MENKNSVPQDPLYRWLWRWHGYAGLFVAPFILFMSLTGLPYVWEHELEDLWHPEYRALTPKENRVSYEQQLAIAQAALPGAPLLMVKVDHDPRHATQFMFGSALDPTSVMINPYDGTIVRSLREWTRLSFAGIQLHGLAFMKPYGSWLQELLACWGIVLCITGVYLWWPREPGRWWGVLAPRLRAEGRTRWRDLHAVTGFYLSAILVLYLVTGLPWTSFWGGKIFGSVAQATGQGYPMMMTSFAGTRSSPPTPDSKRLPLDAFVNFALAQHLSGQMEITLPRDPAGTVHVQNRLKRAPEEKHFQLDLYSAQPVGSIDWQGVPPLQKAIGLGVSMHEGNLLGRPNQILSTVLACLFSATVIAGILMWWKRRPQGRLDLPKIVPQPRRIPGPLKVLLVALGLVMPLLGLSLVLLGFASMRKGVPGASS